jgi:hypothetical protein
MALQAVAEGPLAVAQAATRTLKAGAALATISEAEAALRLAATADLKFLTRIFPSNSRLEDAGQVADRAVDALRDLAQSHRPELQGLLINR